MLMSEQHQTIDKLTCQLSAYEEALISKHDQKGQAVLVVEKGKNQV